MKRADRAASPASVEEAGKRVVALLLLVEVISVALLWT